MAFLQDGFSTLIIGSIGDLSVVFKEKEVQPPGLDGRGGVDTTTMRNSTLTTMSPKKLKTVSEMTLQVSYDTKAYALIYAVYLGQNASWSVSFPDGSILVFWGFLDKFTPSSNKEGEFPLAEIKIIPSNHDDNDPPNEVVPTWPT